jgi:hypothetical protein
VDLGTNFHLPLFVSLVLIIFVSFLILWGSFSAASAYDPIKLSPITSHEDKLGNLFITGVVNNRGESPINVRLAQEVKNADGSISKLENSTLSSIIFPQIPSPFKIKIEAGKSPIGNVTVEKVSKIMVPYYDALINEYNNTAGKFDKSLTGILVNNGSVTIPSTRIYASVHDKNGMQLDSIISTPILDLKPGQTVRYTITPDKSIIDKVFYFSCAGLDINAPINTLKIGKNKFLAYELQSASKISDFRYDDKADTLIFKADHYNPAGGFINLKIPQVTDNQITKIYLDNEIDNNSTTSRNGKTIEMNIFVPPKEHLIQIHGITLHDLTGTSG